jgi:uncharacterized protein YjgD (DUF1641 family)
MDDALILEKLDNLSKEIHTLKAGVLAELKQDMIPIVHQTGPLVSDCLSDLDQENRREDLVHFMRNLVLNVETLNSLLTTAKGAMELKEEFEPIAKMILPKATEVFAQIDGQYDPEELTALFRNTLGNIHHFNTAIGMLKSTMELKEEIEPIAKLALPNIIEFFGEIGGAMKVAGTALESLKDCKCTPEQAEAMSEVIRNIDLSKSKKIGPIGAFKKLNDPKVQESLGIMFTMLEAFGSLVQAHRENA